MRKFLFNGSVLSALFSGWSVLQTTRKGPRDWRLALTWVAWLATTIVAVGTVIEDDRMIKGRQQVR
ncbi:MULTISPECIES: hypothetical protein [unclassified Curtobacterium]|uniref:hypothetical protein n=1 Tax=unclassified Curtobacterium TaxID=257496 RepID=UPI000DA8FF95|nr:MULTISPECIES: hypothetical protein [unclassified Curtobacterium]PZE23010.1 hypothetical protein DEI86_15765 [Curtobacterium sp. MCBD17_028]PZE75022.1 hypothetical protein DEI82_09045 [Curtobacterium sp. MCBD17_019]PZF58456.1 hypothetical protein DEI92_10235 [Curtobacterium sp. MCBD17_034]PZF64487.1 hypothetical protein DEI81_05995 [Curtobacterium sp. MCBD17_013]PZM34445.1 hypothetical protein DEI90_06805 [Curtobacterium sp. MCBD17_031]